MKTQSKRKKEKINYTLLIVGLTLIGVVIGLVILDKFVISSFSPTLSSICLGTVEECYNQNRMCKTYNIEGKDCIRDGMTGGLFDDGVYYICKDYGKVAYNCIDYYSYEEFKEFLK